jgi:hypothetical protein
MFAQPVANMHASSAPHKARIDIGLSGGFTAQHCIVSPEHDAA